LATSSFAPLVRPSSPESKEVAGITAKGQPQEPEEPSTLESLINHINLKKEQAAKAGPTLGNLLQGFHNNTSVYEAQAIAGQNQQVLENRLTSIEEKLVSELSAFRGEMVASVNVVCEDMARLKVELREADHPRNQHIEAVIDGVVKQSMSQLNLVVSRGLEQFLDQVRPEVDGLRAEVVKSREELQALHEAAAQQMSQVLEQTEAAKKQLKDIERQSILLYQLQEHMANNVTASLSQSAHSSFFK
jgi:hypothetical protein